MRKYHRGGAVAAIVLAVTSAVGASCGGAPPPSGETTPAAPAPPREPEGPARARGDASASAVVGRQGGTFELSNGARLEIPAGATTTPVELTFSVTNASGALRHEGTELIGPGLRVQPSLESVGAPCVLSIPFGAVPEGYTDADLAVAIEEESAQQRALGVGGIQTRWQNYPITHAEGRLRASLDVLPGYRFQFLVSR